VGISYEQMTEACSITGDGSGLVMKKKTPPLLSEHGIEPQSSGPEVLKLIPIRLSSNQQTST